MSESGIKVTDRRMFTADGELRQDVDNDDAHRHDDTPVDSERIEVPSAAQSSRPAPEVSAPDEPRPASRPTAAPQDSRSPSAESMGPSAPVHFGEIVAALAEPAAIFLGDAALPDGQVPEDLDRARYYIDLLDLLSQKTEGQLDSEEKAVLSEILYRLKMRYVQKRG